MSRDSGALASNHGSSRMPLSKEMCRRLRSIEYGFFALAATGMPCFSAKAIISARPGNCCRNRSCRQGRSPRSPGARAAAVSSKRTWSLPLPVAPCATAFAPSVWAISIMRLAMRGRAMLVPRKILPLVERPGLDHREDEIARELLAQIIDLAAARAGPERLRLQAVEFLRLAHIRAKRDHLRLVRFLQPTEDDRRVQPARIRDDDFHRCARKVRAPGHLHNGKSTARADFPVARRPRGGHSGAYGVVLPPPRPFRLPAS